LAWQNLELVHRSSVAHQFARYALALQYESLPPEVVHSAKRILLDALGCAIAAHDAPGRAILEGAAKELSGPPEATVFGSGMHTSALNATLVNSLMVRYLDYNDTGGGLHNSDAIPPLLAVAEREKASARAFLTSMVISYELGARVMESIIGPVLEPRGWTADSRAGLSMPAPIGKLMRLNEDQIASAIGLTGARTLCLGILDCNREDMAMAKDLQFGFGAYNAILSCILANRGFTGYVRVVEGDKGFKQTVLNDEMDLERLTDFSGWRILKGGLKTICQNGTTHSCILATLAIVKENDLKPEDIASVRVKTSARDARHVTSIPSRKYPRNTESASHSAFFGNAMVIKERALGP
jgi:2-methylcitrate dehydratase